jgi:hypothetical protein
MPKPNPEPPDKRNWIQQHPDARIGYYVLLGLLITSSLFFMFGPDRSWEILRALGSKVGVVITSEITGQPPEPFKGETP